MTGTDRLRTLADAWGLWAHDGALADVANQIEREQNEDADAIAWVREHGGLDHVKSEWRSRVPYNLYERRRQRLLGHIAECETALGRRRESINAMNRRIDYLTCERDELRKRLMPEGMEWLVEAWPRFEDGEPLRVGDEVCGGGRAFIVDHVVLFSNGESTVCAEADMDSGKVRDYARVRPSYRLKRPAPKVFDADGVEIRVGDTVWGTKGGSYHLTSVHDGKVFARHVGGSFGAEVESAGGSGLYRLRAEQLTHERPDSWDRLEEDARQLDIDLNDTTDDYPRMSCCRDLVRRAKELAGVSE